MDRIHGLRLTSLRASLNDGRWPPDRRLGLNQVNHYSCSNLHSISRNGRLGATLVGGRCSCRRHHRPTAAAHRSKTLLALRSTKLDKVFTYGIVAMQRTYFAHHGRTSGNRGGWCGQGGSAQAWCQWWRAPGLLRLNVGHQ
jgi:hypothetical protein